MNYESGEIVAVGDQIMIESGRTPGRVTEVVESPTQMKHLALDVPGVMVKSAPFGHVFWPVPHEDPAVFVSRGAA